MNLYSPLYILPRILFFCSFFCHFPTFSQNNQLVLANEHLKVVWKKSKNGWIIEQLQLPKQALAKTDFHPSGEYTVLFSETKPSTEPIETFTKPDGEKFIEDLYKYKTKQWKESISETALNKAGKAYYAYPQKATKQGDTLIFEIQTEVATLLAKWSFDPNDASDLKVELQVHPKKEGYYAVATPTLASVPLQEMQWVSVPGYFQSSTIAPHFPVAYAYGHGAPNRPVIYHEHSASTLSPLITSKKGITLAVIPNPGVARDPWATTESTQTEWHLGLSHMNRKGQLAPTLYHPVLGEANSYQKPGNHFSWGFRYRFAKEDWFTTLKHAAYHVYQFKTGLQLRQNTQALTSRIHQMHRYLTNPATSLWNIEEYKGLSIGAQSYRGGVIGSDKDAMKNSDYGAMWMLAALTDDSILQEKILPPALNFKLAQQNTTDPFFKGAVEGQYYLAKSKRFVEEWGNVSEPIALTYYVMLDIGNMLLFDPTNEELKKRLRLGADKLLDWQKNNGSWSVAYEHTTREELFKEIEDLRPTFYGLLVAYRILKEPKYLQASRKGADWLLEKAIKTGHFIGVCGDARYAPDFATAQTAQAFLDLYEVTKEKSYLEAAVTAARYYASSVYTHPIPTTQPKLVKGIERKDWEIAQAGLSFEHGGILGSAAQLGPILLASHAGMFIRMAHLTGETLFLDFARSAAIGRHAFVDPATSVASYYWNAMNRGAGPFPHHAWWQVGWITDYLIAEATYRSEGKINFPRGFVTPKVGPHQSYGFAKGSIYGQEASLLLSSELVKSKNPSIEYLLGHNEASKKLFVVLMNNYHQASEAPLTLNLSALVVTEKRAIKEIKLVENNQILPSSIAHTLTIPPYGIQTLVIHYE